MPALYAGVTQRVVWEEGGFYQKFAQFGGAEDSLAPSQSLLQNTESSQSPQYQSQHPDTHPILICPPGAQDCSVDGPLSSGSLSLECALVGSASSLPHCSFLPGLGRAARSLQPVMQGVLSAPPWHPRLLVSPGRVNIPGPCIFCALLSEQRSASGPGLLPCDANCSILRAATSKMHVPHE